jgi:hypothetical protein
MYPEALQRGKNKIGMPWMIIEHERDGKKKAHGPVG